MPIFRLSQELIFPPPSLAVESGILAIGGDLSVERLLLAYQSGIFPWYSEGEPILWFSPDPRLVLSHEDLNVPKSLKRILKSGKFEVRWDTAFREVIESCAQVGRPGQEDTWITREMVEAYTKLHEIGYAHSVETWLEGRLVGGLYGVSLGSAFFGESMFHLVNDASKVALFHLVERTREWGFHFIDAQVTTGHMLRLGAREIPRKQFLLHLQDALGNPTRQGSWRDA